MKGPVIALTTFSPHIENNIKFHLFHMKTVKTNRIPSPGCG